MICHFQDKKSLEGDGNITNAIAFYVAEKYEKILPQHKTSELLVMFPSLSKVFALEVAARSFISLLNHRNFRASVYPYTGTESSFTGIVPVQSYCLSMQGFSQLLVT